MSNYQFEVVFYGEIIADFNLIQVQEDFAKLFSISTEKAAAIFSKPRVVLKRNLEEPIAQRYQDKLAELGMRVVVEKVAVEPDETSGTEAETPNPMSLVPQEESSSTEESETTDAKVGEPREIQFQFNGSGGEYFRIWIVNIFLTLITIGIYSAWAKVRNKRYFYGNTELDGSTFEYLADPMKIFKGRLIAAGVFALASIANQFSMILWVVITVAIMIIIPWAVVRSIHFNAINSSYRGVRFSFVGKVKDAALNFIALPLLTLLSLGLLAPYAFYRQKKFIVENHRFGTSPFSFDAGIKDFYMLFLLAVGVGIGGAILAAGLGVLSPMLSGLMGVLIYLAVFVVFTVKMTNLIYNSSALGNHGFHVYYDYTSYARLFVINSIATLFTLGLFIPWAKVRTARYAAEHIQFVAVDDMNTFVADEKEQVSALGEEFADVFDWDFGL